MAENFTNIAGSPFQDYVAEQIKVRKNFINEFSNPEKVNNKHIIYQNNRNAWIRLTSNVDIKPTHKLWTKYNITDPQLFSKKYILQGGLVNGVNENIINRSGIGEDRLYGMLPNRPLGLKPIPGITSIDLSSAGKLGTLQYADINFICYDLEQLEIMDALYMKLGFSLFLEWGHTYYLSNDSSDLKQPIPLDIFSYKSKEEVMIAIQNKRVETSGNYDAMLGTISNFGWEMKNDGSYECNIKLVGAGEILESLTINQPVDKKTNFTPKIKDEDGNDINEDNMTLADRDLSLLNRALYDVKKVILSRPLDVVKNKVGKTGIKNENYRKVLNNVFSQSPTIFLQFNENNEILGPNICKKGHHYSLLNGLEKDWNNIPDINTSLFNAFSVNYNITDSTNQSSDNQIQTYITLGNLLCILNCTGMIYDSNNSSTPNPYIYIDFNDELNYCKTIEGQVSINPLVCLIPSNIKDNNFGVGYFDDVIFNSINKKGINTLENTSPRYDSRGNLINTDIKRVYTNNGTRSANYLNTSTPKTKARLMHILINIDHVTNILRELRNKDQKSNVYYSDFLNQLLSDISKSLCSLNDFRLLIDDSSKSLKIIDDNQLYNNDELNNLNYTEIPILGKNSIVYNYSFKSKISPKMASMVTIAAQAEPATLGEDSFAISNLSRGLEDRLMVKKYTSSNLEESTETEDSTNSLRLHVENILTKFTINKELIDPSYNTYKNLLISNINKNQTEDIGRIIIPLDFSLDIDGISGIIPNSAFIIPTNLLPSNYLTKIGKTKIAFIIHKINQLFENNKWITRIVGQTINIRFDKEENSINQNNTPQLNFYSGNKQDKPYKKSTIRGLASGAVEPDELYKKLGVTLEQWNIYRNSVALIESGGKYNIVGGSNKHYDGRYQMGKVAKTDGAINANIIDPGHNSQQREKFRNDPKLQEKIFTGFTIANHKRLLQNPKYKNSSNERKLEILGYAHNQGGGAANHWLNTGIVGADGFGTKGTKYTDLISNNFNSLKGI